MRVRPRASIRDVAQSHVPRSWHDSIRGADVRWLAHRAGDAGRDVNERTFRTSPESQKAPHSTSNRSITAFASGDAQSASPTTRARSMPFLS